MHHQPRAGLQSIAEVTSLPLLRPRGRRTPDTLGGQWEHECGSNLGETPI